MFDALVIPEKHSKPNIKTMIVLSIIFFSIFL